MGDIMGKYEQLKIEEFEKDTGNFTSAGLDIVNFIKRKLQEDPNSTMELYDYSGEYYLKPEHFRIGKDLVFKKKQCAGEIPAEVVLGYAYNQIGIPSPIAYPYYMQTYIPMERRIKGMKVYVPDGVITKDIRQVFPTAEKKMDIACHTFKGLFTDENCLASITHKGRLSRIKETIASIAFNNKDAGFENSFWIRNPRTGKYESIVSIDHGYSGRDSMYGKTKDDVMSGLYFKGEHGYNGMYDPEEDRATILYFLKRLLAGQNIDGVQFTDAEIKELNDFVEQISRLDFNKISNEYKQKFNYDVSSRFLFGLEISREDLCMELS